VQDLYGDVVSEDVLEIFSIFDEDGSGEVDKQEMVNFFKSLFKAEELEPNVKGE